MLEEHVSVYRNRQQTPQHWPIFFLPNQDAVFQRRPISYLLPFKIIMNLFFLTWGWSLALKIIIISTNRRRSFIPCPMP